MLYLFKNVCMSVKMNKLNKSKFDLLCVNATRSSAFQWNKKKDSDVPFVLSFQWHGCFSIPIEVQVLRNYRWYLDNNEAPWCLMWAWLLLCQVTIWFAFYLCIQQMKIQHSSSIRLKFYLCHMLSNIIFPQDTIYKARNGTLKNRDVFD